MKKIVLLLLTICTAFLFSGCGLVNQYHYTTDKYLYKKNTIDREFRRYAIVQRNLDYDPNVYKQEKRIRIEFNNYERTMTISSYIDNADYASTKIIDILQAKRSRNDWSMQPFLNTSLDADKIFVYDIDGKTFIVSFYIGQHKFDSLVTQKDPKDFKKLQSLFK